MGRFGNYLGHRQAGDVSDGLESGDRRWYELTKLHLELTDHGDLPHGRRTNRGNTHSNGFLHLCLAIYPGQAEIGTDPDPSNGPAMATTHERTTAVEADVTSHFALLFVGASVHLKSGNGQSAAVECAEHGEKVRR
jgi:hypothetical protein